MRLKHGLQMAPKGPLPQAAPSALDAVVQSLQRIEGALAKLEARLDSCSKDRHAELASELQATLEKIEHFRSAAPGEDAIAQAARFRRLGLLRRRQAELLYELGSETVRIDDLLA